MSAPNPESGFFGFEPIAPEEKDARVRAVFSSVADKYDLMNDLMSAGLHRLWKDYFVNQMAPRAGETILDVAGGTGDIAIRCAARGNKKIIVCDINPDMLRVGREKAINAGWLDEINWIAGSAEALPFAESSVDLACISFGLRNVARIDTALAEFYRVLKPGGRFYCMEFSPTPAAPLKALYDFYSFTVLPWLGERIAQDKAAYQYLAESIRQFPAPESLLARMKAVGFERARFETLTGGVVAIHSGWRL